MDFKVHFHHFSYEEDANGEKTILETERDEVIPNPDNRHDAFCAYCGFSTYPNCRKWCPNDAIWRERNPEAGATFKKQWFEEHPEDHEPFPEDR